MVLRQQYGIGAREALTEIPEWEVRMLVAAAAERLNAAHEQEGG